METLGLAIRLTTIVMTAIGAAIDGGDSSILDKPVRELIGGELATTLAKKAADARAALKFGVAP
jgi:hypothetical protein